MNILTCVGRLGRDAEVRHLESGRVVASLAIAVNTGFGDKQKTIWYRGSLWGKRAEGGLIQYLTKGTQVAVSGDLSEHEWTADDGVVKKSLELNINDIDLVGGKKQVENDFANPPAQQQPSGTGGGQYSQPNVSQSTGQSVAPDNGFSENPEPAAKPGQYGAPTSDDIPFMSPYKHREYLL